ncbi:glycosyltransferase [Blastopirellula marina]|nr:glycosyltransferase [Blastopirellula marina]
MRNDSGLAPGSEPLRIGIVKGFDISPVSETFILAHAELLSSQSAIVDGVFPRLNGHSILGDSLIARTLRTIRKKVLVGSQVKDQDAAYAKFIKTWKPDAILAEYGTSGVAVMGACKRYDVPLVVHFHGYDASRKNVLKEFSHSYRQMFRQAAAIVAVSRLMQRQLIAMGAPDNKVHYNSYGVDCTRFASGRPGRSACTFLAVGRLVDKKAPYLTLLAFQQVVKQCPDAKLIIVGDGPLRSACCDLVRGLHLTEHVEMVGAKSHGEVQALMQSSRAFVQHSVRALDGDCEGTPVAIIEASASGLPVVATRHAGIPDVVIEGSSGYLVDECDVDGMAAYMLRLARDPSLAEQMGIQGRRIVEERFSIEKSIGALREIINNSISQARKSLAS